MQISDGTTLGVGPISDVPFIIQCSGVQIQYLLLKECLLDCPSEEGGENWKENLGSLEMNLMAQDQIHQFLLSCTPATWRQLLGGQLSSMLHHILLGQCHLAFLRGTKLLGDQDPLPPQEDRGLGKDLLALKGEHVVDHVIDLHVMNLVGLEVEVEAANPTNLPEVDIDL